MRLAVSPLQPGDPYHGVGRMPARRYDTVQLQRERWWFLSLRAAHRTSVYWMGALRGSSAVFTYVISNGPVLRISSMVFPLART